MLRNGNLGKRCRKNDAKASPIHSPTAPMLRTSDGLFSRPQTAFARSSSVRSLHLSSLLSETVSCDRDRGQMSFSPNSHELASPSGMSLPRSGAGPITLLMAVNSICKAADRERSRPALLVSGLIKAHHDLWSGRLCPHLCHAIQRWWGVLLFLGLIAFRQTA